MSELGEDTPKKQGKQPPWKPGQSGNPAGRPKGARSKLGEDFLKKLQADFEEHGKEVIEKVRQEKPDAYLKVVASILPKEINVKDDDAASNKEQRDAAIAAYMRARMPEASGKPN